MQAHILLVDDEPNIRLTLAAILTGEGFSIDVAASAKEALSKLQTAPYDVVITDMHMETATAGYEVVHAAHAQAYSPITVVLTGYASQCADWEEHGAHALLEKPAKMEEVLLTLDTLLREHQRVARGIA